MQAGVRTFARGTRNDVRNFRLSRVLPQGTKKITQYFTRHSTRALLVEEREGLLVLCGQCGQFRCSDQESGVLNGPALSLWSNRVRVVSVNSEWERCGTDHDGDRESVGEVGVKDELEEGPAWAASRRALPRFLFGPASTLATLR